MDDKVKITLELCPEEIEHIQDLSDSRSHSSDPDYFESEYTVPDWEREPYEFLFMIVDAALAQGHINPYTVPPVTQLWRTLEKIKVFSNNRNREIVKQFNAYNRGDITESELYAFKDQYPCPFHLLSKRLEAHELVIRFEVKEGHPFLDFYRDGEKVCDMMTDFTDREIACILQESRNLIETLETTNETETETP